MNPEFVKNKVLARLRALTEDVEKFGLNGLEDRVQNLKQENALDEATDSFAGGFLLSAIIFDTCDQLSNDPDLWS